MIIIIDNLARSVIRKLRYQKDRILYPADKVNSLWARKRFYSNLLNPGDLVFDVGANHGAHRPKGPAAQMAGGRAAGIRRAETP